jgi:hypothetical protein
VEEFLAAVDPLWELLSMTLVPEVVRSEVVWALEYLMASAFPAEDLLHVVTRTYS